MMLEMYSIKDELNGYTTPIPIMSKELAKRYFKDQVIGNVTMKNSPKDFSLWKMGTFDTEAGNYINEPNGNQLIVRGESYADAN